MKIKYTLTMESEQARKCLKAVELLMRLKLEQYDQLPYCILDLGDDKYAEKRNESEPLLKAAFRIMFRDHEPGNYKDEEWYMLYNIYQALRYQIHLAENPTGTGVDSYPPMRISDAPMPECYFEKGE